MDHLEADQACVASRVVPLGHMLQRPAGTVGSYAGVLDAVAPEVLAADVLVAAEDVADKPSGVDRVGLAAYR